MIVKQFSDTLQSQTLSRSRGGFVDLNLDLSHNPGDKGTRFLLRASFTILTLGDLAARTGLE